jgi:excisionase family DNA binding protein
MSSTPLLLSIPDFCKLHGIGRSTTYRIIASGQLKARKIGRRTFIEAEDAQAWRNSLPSFQSSVDRTPANNDPKK